MKGRRYPELMENIYANMYYIFFFTYLFFNKIIYYKLNNFWHVSSKYCLFVGFSCKSRKIGRKQVYSQII